MCIRDREIIDGITAGKLDMAGVGGIIFKILITGLIIMAGRFGWRYFIIGASRGIEYRLSLIHICGFARHNRVSADLF